MSMSMRVLSCCLHAVRVLGAETGGVIRAAALALVSLLGGIALALGMVQLSGAGNGPTELGDPVVIDPVVTDPGLSDPATDPTAPAPAPTDRPAVSVPQPQPAPSTAPPPPPASASDDDDDGDDGDDRDGDD